ncbi:MAG: tRNA pseudouridine(13) synthase TruD [Candidatus Poribacteria bacterium]|nr:tRNA pseudouridine(13) synthase TruD [Candidatus Poribacteria bacterium]
MNGRSLYITHEIPGAGGQIKQTADDFLVDEIPLYEPRGEGVHTYLDVQKRGIPTAEAAVRLGQYFGVNPRDIGYAGMKDAQAVATQRFSIERLPVEEALNARIKNVEILNARLHTNKLRVGHLAGNRFTIRLRGGEPHALESARQVLERLSQTGAPNFYGMQRFSGRRNGHRIGRSILLENWQEALDEYLGRPQPDEPPWIVDARTAYENGDYDAARKRFPLPERRNERRVLGGLLRRLTPKHALRQISYRIRRIFVSAYQSWLFNRVLNMRMPNLGTLLEGDIAYKHRGGACFLATDAEKEQPRADDFEISPTGPLFGVKMLQPTGEPRRMEDRVLQEQGVEPSAMQAAFAAVNGARRPLRVPVMEANAWQEEDAVVCAFRLPSGSYATVVMDEIMKRGTLDLFEKDVVNR